MKAMTAIIMKHITMLLGKVLNPVQHLSCQSLMAALEDGVIDTGDMVDTGTGQ